MSVSDDPTQGARIGATRARTQRGQAGLTPRWIRPRARQPWEEPTTRPRESRWASRPTKTRPKGVSWGRCRRRTQPQRADSVGFQVRACRYAGSDAIRFPVRGDYGCVLVAQRRTSGAE